MPKFKVIPPGDNKSANVACTRGLTCHATSARAIQFIACKSRTVLDTHSTALRPVIHRQIDARDRRQPVAPPRVT